MSEIMGKLNSAQFYPMIAAFLLGPFFAHDLQFSTLISLNIVFHVIEFALLLRIVNPASFSGKWNSLF